MGLQILVCAAQTPDLPSLLDEVKALLNRFPGSKWATSYEEALGLIEAQRYGFDGLIFSGHAEGDVFHWGEKEFEADELARLVSLASPLWVFLNACSSNRMVATIRDRSIVAVIATRTDINDDKATRSMRTFILALATSRGELHAAVEMARLDSPESDYIFLEPGGQLRDERTPEFDEIERRLLDVERSVFGDQRLHYEGLRDVIESQRKWLILNFVVLGLEIFAMLIREVLRG